VDGDQLVSLDACIASERTGPAAVLETVIPRRTSQAAWGPLPFQLARPSHVFPRLALLGENQAPASQSAS
jgi:hypothetical protein